MKEFFDKIREDVNNIIKPRKGDHYDHFNGYAIIPVEDYFNLLGEELPQKYADAIASYKNCDDIKDSAHLNEANDILNKNPKSGYYDLGPHCLKTCNNDGVDYRARNLLDVSVYSGATSQTNFYDLNKAPDYYFHPDNKTILGYGSMEKEQGDRGIAVYLNKHVYGQKERNQVKLETVNMKLAQLGMSMGNSELKHTQQYKDLISIVEYIGMDFKPNE